MQPEASLFVSATVTVTSPRQLSTSVVISNILATGSSALHCKPVMFAGALPVGGVVSSTVMVCTNLVSFPPQSAKV